MGCSNKLAMLVLSIAVVAILLVGETSAQVSDCAQNLIPCAAYLNSTTPPDTCCKPLRETVENQRECLCNLYNNPTLIQSLGINVTQALELPKYCGVSADTSLCGNVSAPSPSTTTTTPLSPPGRVPGGDENSAGKMAWTGVSGLLLFWVSIMAY